MNLKRNIIWTSVLIATLFLTLNYGCRKNKKERIVLDNTEDKQGSNDISAYNFITPIYNTLSPNDKVEQFRRQALGFCNLLSNPQACNNLSLYSRINNIVAGNGESPCRLIDLHNNIDNNALTFYGSTGDLYNGLSQAIVISNPTTPVVAWDTDFYGLFGIKTGPTSIPVVWYTTISLPMREYQFSNNHWQTGSPLILPNPEVFGYPMIGYSYDLITNSIIEVVIGDEDDYEDAMEDQNTIVFSLQYEMDDDLNPLLTSSCGGGGSDAGSWVANDNICDGDCGETIYNSPADCNQGKNKVVYLKRFKMNTDVANRKKKVKSTAGKKYWESWANGKYDPYVSCWTLQTNNKFAGKQFLELQKVKHKDVKRKRIKRNGNVKEHGSSKWFDGTDMNSTSGSLVRLAENYNPNLSVLYISFIEKDQWPESWREVPLEPVSGGTPFDDLDFRGPRGNFTAGKDYSTMWASQSTMALAANKLGIPVPTYISFIHRVYANPTDWVDEVDGNGEPIKVLKVVNGNDNEIDFEIFYYRDKRG